MPKDLPYDPALLKQLPDQMLSEPDQALRRKPRSSLVR